MIVHLFILKLESSHAFYSFFSNQRKTHYYSICVPNLFVLVLRFVWPWLHTYFKCEEHILYESYMIFFKNVLILWLYSLLRFTTHYERTNETSWKQKAMAWNELSQVFLLATSQTSQYFIRSQPYLHPWHIKQRIK